MSASLLATILAAASLGTVERMSPERQREIARAALTAFDQAVDVARDNPARAAELYRTAAASWESLVQQGVANPAIEYNLGNCHVRLGRLGEAILHYRRGLRLNPRDAKLAANLAYARNRVQPALAASGENRILRTLLFAHYNYSLSQRVAAAALLSSTGWLLLLLRLRRKRTALLVLGLLGVFGGAASAASAAWELRQQTTQPPAVVLAEHVLRRGRGDGYDAVMAQPLGAGVELSIIGRSGGWVEVRLPDGQTGWLPEAAVCAVMPT
ncbi:MAG: hypothetical protein CHACPFDD_01483 [Phycisphaerae bacterium]|nr:hypothetical protein [Phycisphaerae bacterium]